MAKLRNFVKGKYFHSYSRGVNRCDIFRDHFDYLKFMSLVEELNCKETKREIKRSGIKNSLVEIHCYTLMPNHFHFVLKELCKCGISKFFQKVLTSYSGYFNNKYDRTGALFSSRFKDKLIDNEYYFYHLVGYIWNNPIKLINPEYKSIDLLYGKINLSDKEKSFALNHPYKKFPVGYSGPDMSGLTGHIDISLNFI